MPFYEYECSACKFYVEALQKVSDAPMKKCPSCSKETLQRLISAPVFRLKGAGWYETDFKSDKENKRNLADSDADKEPAAASDSDDKKPKVRASKALAKSKSKVKPAAKKPKKLPANKKSRAKAGKPLAKTKTKTKTKKKTPTKKSVQKPAKKK